MMVKVKVYTLNAFAKTSRGGNPAGVVLEGSNLSDNEMQKIAQEVGFSETAFVLKSDKADFKVRFFTPNGEVDLCGHATIATFFLMAKLGPIKVGKYTQETKAGILNFEVQDNNFIFMYQNLPQFFDEIDKKEIAESLNISEEIISNDLPVQIVSTGLRDIFIPIKSLKNLHSIKPKFEKVSEISKKYGVVGYHLFTLETKFGSTAHCRNLAPLYDIPEESATGTSSGALSCYLFKYGKISKQDANYLIFEQGYTMNKPSEIFVNLKLQDHKIVEVRVGGVASNIQEKELSI
jgi:PhzF family phenazine biosynthesis protein